CREPTDLPQIEAASNTEAYAEYEKELKKREAEVNRFIETKKAEVLPALRLQVADYLIAARHAPANGGMGGLFPRARTQGLNPLLLQRWHAFLEASRKASDPVWSAWHAFAALPEAEFAARAPALAASLATNHDSKPPVNSLVARAFAEK